MNLENAKLIEMVKQERAANNNCISQFEKDVIKYNIDQNLMTGDTELVFHTQNTLVMSGFPTSLEDVLEYCKEYKPEFNTTLEEIHSYIQRNEYEIKIQKREKYEEIMTPEEAIYVVTAERSISAGLSGLEKTVIERALKSRYSMNVNEEELIWHIQHTLSTDGFPTTIDEVREFVKQSNSSNNLAYAALGTFIIFVLIIVFVGLAKLH